MRYVNDSEPKNAISLSLGRIPAEQYKQIVEAIPILCVDLLVKNLNGEYLLVERTNEPLKGRYWVIGGRVHKGETIRQAATRKAKEELGLRVQDMEFVGFHEYMFRENPFGLESGVHTVSIVFLTTVDGRQRIELDSQAASWKYSKELPEDYCLLPLNPF